MSSIDPYFDSTKEWECPDTSKPNHNSLLVIKFHFNSDADFNHESNMLGNIAIPISITIPFDSDSNSNSSHEPHVPYMFLCEVAGATCLSIHATRATKSKMIAGFFSAFLFVPWMQCDASTQRSIVIFNPG